MSDIKQVLQSEAKLENLGGIAVLFPEVPRQMKLWRVQAAALIWQTRHLAHLMSEHAKSPTLMRATRNRLTTYAKGSEEQAKYLTSLLAPLKPDQVPLLDVEGYLRLTEFRPSELGGYQQNLFRDWAWENQENLDALARVKSLIGGLKPKRCLFLGAGGSRLAYDLHEELAPELTVANDINPLLLLAAKKLARGEKVEIMELPPIAVDAKSVAVKRTLQAPKAAADSLQFLLADGTSGIFADGAFDLVVTQWFIDIVGKDIHDLFGEINRVLASGGVWINIGPLMYNASFEQQYSSEETVRIAEKSGFKVEEVADEFYPYMKAPLWRVHRSEMILSFRATKTEDAEIDEEPSAMPTPPWADDESLPVPAIGNVENMARAARIFATVLEALDGQRSVTGIIEFVAKDLGLTPEVVGPTVRLALEQYTRSRGINPYRS